MDVQLTVVEGPRAGLVYRAKGRTAITIGRSKTTDFHVLDGAMSRVHAVVARDDGGWYVEDRKSRNGVWIGTSKVEKQRLASGTVFHLGRFTAVRFEVVDETRAATEMSVFVIPTCARCGTPISSADDVAKGGDGRPFHLACRGMDHLVGTELGGLKVTEAMSPMGGAFFFLAHQPTLNRTVVLEVFDIAMTSRPGFRDSLLGEVKRASRFLHPNVLQIFDFGEARGMSFVVMENFRGEPLVKVLEERRFVRIREAVSVAVQIGEALAYAREQGSLMGWASPQAVLVSADHEVKVKLFKEPTIVTDEIHAADAPYVAPEVHSAPGRGYEPTALVYSIGAILYHMLAGIPPFEGDSTEEIAKKAQRESPPALRRINIKVSPALAQTVEMALNSKAEARQATLAAFLASLRKAGAPGR